MAQSEQRRQKKLAARKKKQQLERQTLARRKQELSTLAGLVKANSRGAVLECYFIVSGGLDSDGVTMVYVTREASRGQVLLGSFVVDLWCMGVKDCYAKLISPGELRELIQDTRNQVNVQTVTASEAHAIVAGGVEYAAEIEIPPHADYAKVAQIFHDIPRGQVPEGVKFGYQGKRRYIRGRYDSDATVAHVAHALRTHLDEGNYEMIEIIRHPQDRFGAHSALEFSDDEWLEDDSLEDEPLDDELLDEDDDQE